MPRYEYTCTACKKTFEKTVSASSKAEIECPSCGSKKVEKLLSRFAVSGQGDQRESTQHGCHGCHSGHKHGKD